MDNYFEMIKEMGYSESLAVSVVIESLEEKHDQALNRYDMLISKGEDDRAEEQNGQIEKLERALECAQEHLKALEAGVIIDEESDADRLDRLRNTVTNESEYEEIHSPVSSVNGQASGSMMQPQTSVNINQNKIDTLMNRANQDVRDHLWGEAKERFDEVLDMDPENSDAYFGFWLSKFQLDIDDIPKGCWQYQKNHNESPFDDSVYKRAYRWGDDERKKYLDEYKTATEYLVAEEALQRAKSSGGISEFNKAKELFKTLGDFKDAKKKVQFCNETIKRKKEEKEKIKSQKKKAAKYQEEVERFKDNISNLTCTKKVKNQIDKYHQLNMNANGIGKVQLFHITATAIIWYVMHQCKGVSLTEMWSQNSYLQIIYFSLMCGAVLRAIVYSICIAIDDRGGWLIIYLIVSGFSGMAIVGLLIANKKLPENLLQHETIFAVITVILCIIFLVQMIYKFNQKQKLKQVQKEAYSQKSEWENQVVEEFKTVYEKYNNNFNEWNMKQEIKNGIDKVADNELKMQGLWYRPPVLSELFVVPGMALILFGVYKLFTGPLGLNFQDFATIVMTISLPAVLGIDINVTLDKFYKVYDLSRI